MIAMLFIKLLYWFGCVFIAAGFFGMLIAEYSANQTTIPGTLTIIMFATVSMVAWRLLCERLMLTFDTCLQLAAKRKPLTIPFSHSGNSQ